MTKRERLGATLLLVGTIALIFSHYLLDNPDDDNETEDPRVRPTETEKEAPQAPDRQGTTDDGTEG
jgi:hypothetical protein